MAQYVTGLLVRNKAGAAAPGSSVAVTRWLVIQVPNGTTIRVFDYRFTDNELLSEQEGVVVGKRYTFLLTALTHLVENIADTPNPLEGDDIWQGTIIRTQWELSQRDYLAVDPDDIGNYQGVLVETTIGQVIIPHHSIGNSEHPISLRQGDILRWNHGRLDLLAIVKAAP